MIFHLSFGSVLIRVACPSASGEAFLGLPNCSGLTAPARTVTLRAAAGILLASAGTGSAVAGIAVFLRLVLHVRHWLSPFCFLSVSCAFKGADACGLKTLQSMWRYVGW